MKQNGAVLITGTSSGIGAGTAKKLARQGVMVFAGVRNKADMKPGESDNLIHVLLDVTDSETIAQAVEHVTGIINRENKKLIGLVNNATVEYHGPLEILPLKLMRHEMDVNYFGTVAVTKAFLPLLRQSRGRIVNISSINGRCVYRSIGSNCAAKYAIEAISDALRLELAPWGIQVALIEPGGVATPLWKKALYAFEDLPNHVSQDELNLYYPSWEKALQTARSDEERFYKDTIPVESAARAITHALLSDKPKTRYLVGQFAKTTALLKWLLPDRLFDRIAMKEFRDQDR